MFPRARLGGGNSALAWTIAGWIVFTAASVNTLLFVLLYTNPIIVADDWYFLSAFLRPALEGNLEFSDFFVYRGSGDHVQPLHKAILLMELNWFNLDYTPSAVIGVFSGAACSLILAWVLRHCCEGKVPEHIKFFAWALATATLFSLNTTGSWRWPLAAMGHLTSALSFFLIAFTWSELQKERICRIWPVVIILSIATDDAAILVSGAILSVLVICWLRREHSTVIPRLAVGWIVSILIAQAFISSFATVIGETGQIGTISEQIGKLLQVFLSEGWWKWWVLPLSNSVVSAERLQGLLGGYAVGWQLFVSLSLLTLHLWFWRRFIREKANGASFFAASLMILFYGHVIGIIFFRVPVFGTEYLDQPRYILFYQFNLVALAVMFSAYFRPPKLPSLRRLHTTGIMFFLFGFFAVQVEWSRTSWATANHLLAYYHKAATDIVEMGINPGETPENCTAILPLCAYSEERRVDAIGLLQRFELNIFSDRFRVVHGLAIDSLE